MTDSKTSTSYYACKDGSITKLDSHFKAVLNIPAPANSEKILIKHFIIIAQTLGRKVELRDPITEQNLAQQLNVLINIQNWGLQRFAQRALAYILKQILPGNENSEWKVQSSTTRNDSTCNVM